MIQTLFTNNDAIFQDDNAPTHTAEAEEHEGGLQHLPWPAQSPDLNIIEPLWSVLQTRVKKSFPPSISLKQLENVLQEEWYKIPLETVQNVYKLIPRRTIAILRAKGGPAPC
jgi:transposase